MCCGRPQSQCATSSGLEASQGLRNKDSEAQRSKVSFHEKPVAFTFCYLILTSLVLGHAVLHLQPTLAMTSVDEKMLSEDGGLSVGGKKKKPLKQIYYCPSGSRDESGSQGAHEGQGLVRKRVAEAPEAPEKVACRKILAALVEREHEKQRQKKR